MSTRYIDYFNFARDIARRGGEKTLEYFRRDITVERKADESPVTVADRETELVLRRAIQDRYPDHAVVGEEYGGELGSREWEWILDPIDGTKSFIRGVPLYTTLVALVHQGRPVLGVIHAPVTGETAAAVIGGGCRDENDLPLGVSGCTDLANAWYVTTDPHDFSTRLPEANNRLIQSCGAARTWADAYGYMLLARGAVDLMIDPIMSPWDIAPLSVIVREAGGIFTSIAGEREDLGSSAVAAATGALHRQALAVIDNATDGEA
jgi:histidinol-phosphatase